MAPDWRALRWLVVLHGISDGLIFGFDTDEWALRCDQPAYSRLGLLPLDADGELASQDDALWVADVLSFDHDAPVGVVPATSGFGRQPKDTSAAAPVSPLFGIPGVENWYWDNLGDALSAAASNRFYESFVLRYQGTPSSPDTNFRARFRDKEGLVSMYAMAARQADVLSEYLCLYRLLEAADGGNGRRFAATQLPKLEGHDFGELLLYQFEDGSSLSVFESYRQSALVELGRLASSGVTDVPGHLYRIRNSLAHGKKDVLTHADGPAVDATVRALPLVKLLARLAVEG